MDTEGNNCTATPATKHKSDVLENTIGNFGRYQCGISVCMALLKLPIAWIQMSIVFLAPVTEYWCRQPEDYRIYSKDQWLKIIRPLNFSSYANSTFQNPKYERCFMTNIELPELQIITKCKWGIEYDRKIFENSIITEWGLVCDKEHYVDFAQTILMLGVLIGNIFFGYLADKHGRRCILLFCIVLQSITSLMLSWVPWLEAFLFLRFLMGFANGGTMITSFVMCMEIVGGRWRYIVPVLYQIPFGLGNTIMAFAAYQFRSWREFQVSLAFMSAIFIIYIWLIPESPRWLIAKSRRKDAWKVIEKAAKCNKTDLVLSRTNFMELYTNLQNRDNDRSSGVSHLLLNSTIRYRTSFLLLNWFLSGLSLYSFTQYLGQVGSNIYFNVSVGGLIIVPGTFLCVVCIHKCGRRRTIFVVNIFIALCLSAILFIPNGQYSHDWPRILFAAMGVIGLSISTPTLYLYTGELYPTIIRNIGLGACIMISRVGSMISPFIVSGGITMSELPLILLTLSAVLQSILILPLPESENVFSDTFPSHT